MNEPIMLTIGIADEVNHLPMTFLIYEEHGVKFEDAYTRTDLTIAKAVLLDLADALEKKLSSMVN